MSGPSRVSVTWQGARRFETARTAAPAVTQLVDAGTEVAPGPVETLLGALASCTAVDVLEILAKRRTPAASLHIAVEGDRVDAIPRRLRAVALHYTITGDGIEAAQAERAVELAVTKYCSVRDSLREDIPVSWTVTLGVPTAGPASGTR